MWSDVIGCDRSKLKMSKKNPKNKTGAIPSRLPTMMAISSFNSSKVILVFI